MIVFLLFTYNPTKLEHEILVHITLSIYLATNALTSLCKCPDLSEHSLLVYKNMDVDEKSSQNVKSLIADPRVVSLIPARPYSFVEIDHEIFSLIRFLLPLTQSTYFHL